MRVDQNDVNLKFGFSLFNWSNLEEIIFDNQCLKLIKNFNFRDFQFVHFPNLKSLIFRTNPNDTSQINEECFNDRVEKFKNANSQICQANTCSGCPLVLSLHVIWNSLE